MNGLQMNLTVRDITVNRDFQITLPMEDLCSCDNICPGHEYIIIENDNTLNPGEFCSLNEVNELLQDAAGKFSKQELRILSTVYIYEEVKQIVEQDKCLIVDFDAETQGWNCGNGGNYTEEDYGRCLYEQGYNYLPELVPDGLMDYISWELNWSGAESSNWRAVSGEDNVYLVNAGI